MSARVFKFGLLVCLAVIIVACSPQAVEAPADSPPAEQPPAAPTAVVPADLAVVTLTSTIRPDARLDPAIVSGADGEDGILEVSRRVYDTLVRVENGQVVPGLARAWQVSDDGLTYEVFLRANAAFSDGTPVSTEVVMDNFNRWFDPQHPLHGSDSDIYQTWLFYFEGFRDQLDANEAPLSKFDGIEKVDDLRFLLHIFEPMENFLEILADPQFSILNPALLAAEGERYGTRSGSVDGSGPYVIESWNESGLTLAPNPRYWGDLPQDKVIFPAP